MQSLRVVRSPEELQEMVREYFRRRLEEALEVLGSDSSALAEVLNEMFALVIGEEEVEGWQPVALEDARARIGDPRIAPKMETNAAER